MRSTVTITEQGEEYIRHGQLWMYVNNLASNTDDLTDGQIVDIMTESGEYLATGFLSKHSHITVRILSHDRKEPVDERFFENRIQAAYSFRKTVEPVNLSDCRLIFGEADGLPGLTVDRYDDVLVSEITCAGMEIRRETIYRLLLKVLQEDGQNVQAIYERNDTKARDKEGLESYSGFYGNTEHSSPVVINENGLRLYVDFIQGQKTGYFLDQKSNRLLIRHMARGKKVLDCFTHTGGFALNAALGNASDVTAVDVSASALAEGRKNAELNHLNNVHFVQADVFDYLDTLRKNQFDLIILDPPAFAKSRRSVMKAYNGYKRINAQAMKSLAGGGYLATCSCSRYMENELFEKMLREAAEESGVMLKQISVTQQNGDHPVLWNMSETAYLKFYIFQII